ncbi:TAT-variant-translocated molybdopterin oxidoreductase [Ancylobacter sp. MQZ15Z-1]|uniref:TAT-variant-translocated molybdopterin oxidoreductase n=1 Tax=Ancylobacter mangrovi TaxID=2972472 RepID=A0A9X2PDJ4_9HYPH|nr:TAT-variant-translocated molybdopterin oxidoreductase [Ancylobacter mangrovi]MCS0493995.1 TAT-variant-translocated molybdopterin oxidoreductase [Ancylobacter mangrovi]
MPDAPRDGPAGPGRPSTARFGERLAGRTGRAFWRSLEELAGTPEFAAALREEFPAAASLAGVLDRRSLLRAMAASLALSGLTGFEAHAEETALPYVEQPEGEVPGIARWYATAVTFGGFAQPALGKTYAGRPVKLEGNPDHPATGGASDVFLQAALLGLYDPGRSQAPRRLGRPATWAAFDDAVLRTATALDATQGEGLRLLTGTVTSPTMARQIAALGTRWPKARWHVWEPMAGSGHEATARVFGRPLDMHARLDRAEAVVCLDADPLGPGAHQSVNARRWSARREAFRRGEGGCRFLVAEAVPSLTGMMAGDRLVAAEARVAALLLALAAEFGVAGASAPDLAGDERRWLADASAALRAAPGRGLVLAGERQPPEFQALALLVNERIGALGTGLTFTAPVAVAPPEGMGSLPALVEDMAAGQVSALVMLGTNPAYTAPAGVDFRAALDKVAFRLHAGLHHDETAALCHWHAPLAHELESWSDARAVDGTASIVQPLIRPFYAVRGVHEILANLAGDFGSGSRDIVQATWRDWWGEAFDGRWRDALLRGFVEGSAPDPVTPAVATRDVPPVPAAADGLTVCFRPDPTMWDGRFSDNAWLQETPKPFSKVTWGNVVAVSPALAAERGLATGDEVTLTLSGRRLTGAVWVMPGQERSTLALTFGYGRRHEGGLGAGFGYDAFALRPEGRWSLAGAELAKTGGRQQVATTQTHQAMDGFDFVRTVATPGEAVPKADDAPSFYPRRHWDSPSWGMSIDLDSCIGCNACVVACVAENNVPMVGKDLVAQGREMHWLRVDHYYEGDPAAPKSYVQPVPCMHCEQAPCEMGCPVNATVHSSDGLNLQVYNRCIGTRTCSSFCPYKVRRFNWFDFTSADPPEMRAARNPDVTVRGRGVMEKCTYCVQRIAETRITAQKEGRPIHDGEVVTACQQACPTRAISFGDVTDAASAVSGRKASPRSYALLEEANTRPRTTYLARVEPAGNDGGGEAG